MPTNYSLIAAVGTPLTSDESLDADALVAHIADQWDNSMTGILVGGTMGLMQLLTDGCYRELVAVASSPASKRGEVMVGVGDASFARTRDRIRFLNDKDVDALVILSPYLVRFTQPELVSYFTALADVAKRPVYLYDLPGMTGTKLEIETVLTLAKHPNISGIKCSGEFGGTRQLIDLAPSGFRVIAAQADLVDTLFHHGVTDQLDGVFALAPAWTSAIAHAATTGQWEQAASHQRRLSTLLRVMKQYGIFQTFTALLNERGVGGNFAPSPMGRMSDTMRNALLAEPIVKDLLANHPRADMRKVPVGHDEANDRAASDGKLTTATVTTVR